MEGQKVQLVIKKHGVGMMLVIVLVRSRNYGRSGKGKQKYGEITRSKEKS